MDTRKKYIDEELIHHLRITVADLNMLMIQHNCPITIYPDIDFKSPRWKEVFKYFTVEYLQSVRNKYENSPKKSILKIDALKEIFNSVVEHYSTLEVWDVREFLSRVDILFHETYNIRAGEKKEEIVSTQQGQTREQVVQVKSFEVCKLLEGMTSKEIDNVFAVAKK